MIGDLRIYIQDFVRQHLLCRHDYKHHIMKCYPHKPYEECPKCGRMKF